MIARTLVVFDVLPVAACLIATLAQQLFNIVCVKPIWYSVFGLLIFYTKSVQPKPCYASESFVFSVLLFKY